MRRTEHHISCATKTWNYGYNCRKHTQVNFTFLYFICSTGLHPGMIWLEHLGTQKKYFQHGLWVWYENTAFIGISALNQLVLYYLWFSSHELVAMCTYSPKIMLSNVIDHGCLFLWIQYIKSLKTKMISICNWVVERRNRHTFILIIHPHYFLFYLFREDGQKNVNKEYHIFFVPRKSMLCEMRLQVGLLFN